MKTRLVVHLAAQILAQGAVVALIHSNTGKEWYAAAVAVVGVLVAFYDTTAGLVAAGKV